MKQYVEKVDNQIVSFQETDFSRDVRRLLTSSNEHIILVGGKGLGKSYFIRKYVEPLLWTSAELSQRKEVYLGFWDLTESGGLVRKPGLLHKINKDNPNLLIEEIGFMPSVVASPLFTALDGARSVHIDETGDYINLPENFRVFGTANSLSSLPDAFLDRFLIIKLTKALVYPITSNSWLNQRIAEEVDSGVSLRAIMRALGLINVVRESDSLLSTLSSTKESELIKKFTIPDVEEEQQ